MDTNELIKNKVEYFYKKQIAVHITKRNGYFHNGFILEFALDLIILDDEKNGSMPIYFEEILEIEERRQKENG